jgi:hypothetical protein
MARRRESGGSVASASEARESMIMFTHSICSVVGRGAAVGDEWQWSGMSSSGGGGWGARA